VPITVVRVRVSWLGLGLGLSYISEYYVTIDRPKGAGIHKGQIEGGSVSLRGSSLGGKRGQRKQFPPLNFGLLENC